MPSVTQLLEVPMVFRSNPITPTHVTGVVACVVLLAVAVLASFGRAGGVEPRRTAVAATDTVAKDAVADLVIAGRTTVRVLVTGVLAVLDAFSRPLEVTLNWIQLRGFGAAVPQKAPSDTVRREPPGVHRLPGTNPPQS
jgi:hypothetical protein